jgi:phosphotransferase system enzyme I (PtsI)
MCGEMAGDAMSIPILLGLGLDAFSMSSTSIPKARMIINNLNYAECQMVALNCVNLTTQAEVNDAINKFLSDKNLLV